MTLSRLPYPKLRWLESEVQKLQSAFDRSRREREDSIVGTQLMTLFQTTRRVFR